MSVDKAYHLEREAEKLELWRKEAEHVTQPN